MFKLNDREMFFHYLVEGILTYGSFLVDVLQIIKGGGWIGGGGVPMSHAGNKKW